MRNTFISIFVSKQTNVAGNTQSINVGKMNPFFFGSGVKILTALFNFNLVLTAFLLDLFTKVVIPGISLFPWMLVAILTDFVTAILKAMILREGTPSKKMRETFPKLLQYIGTVILVTILINVTIGEKNIQEVSFAVNMLYSLMILIELRSIAENFRDMSPNSRIAKVIMNPLLTMIDIKIRGNRKVIDTITVELKNSQNEDAQPPPDSEK